MSSVLHYLTLHPQWGWAIAFIISFAQDIFIIGLVIPGTVVIIGLGCLVGAGLLPLWSTLIGAIVGSLLGASVSYHIGYSLKDRLPTIWPFSRYQFLIRSGKSFFAKYGGKSVFVGRFLGIFAAIIPITAGIMGMRPKLFYISAILSGILWSVIYTFVGVISLKGFLHLSDKLIVMIAFVLLLLLFGWFFFIYRKRQLCK